ncbi:MAG: hypothetical protein JSU68_13325 [Phycisphaerales bacterium]|nr:MAG: hypothetical protein JSU68_13325 [Phycisphaerales bacterium]
MPRITQSSCHIHRAVLLAWLAAWVLLPAAVPAADPPEALRDRTKSDFDEQAIHALDFMLTLSLTREQARDILPIIEDACRLHLDHHRRLAETQPERIEAYTAFLEEDRLNQGFSPKVERRAAQVHRQGVAIRDERAAALNDLSDRVWEHLTDEQRLAAEEYKPRREAVSDALATRSEKLRAARHRALRGETRPPRHHDGNRALDEARRERAELYRSVHEMPDNIATYLLSPAAAGWLYKRAGEERPDVVRRAVECQKNGTSDYPLEQCKKDDTTARALSREINNWNLVNGMHFSCEQIEELIRLIHKAENLKVALRHSRPPSGMSRRDYNAAMVQLELAAEDALNPGQLEVLKNYHPCLVPPQNLKNPVRVGQAADNTQMTRWLQQARTKPERRVEIMIDQLLEKEEHRFGEFGPDELERRRNLLRDTVRKAADMDDVEFALNKDALAEAIQPTNPLRELVGRIDELSRARLMPGNTAKFLLHKEMAEVLRIRHQQLTGPFASQRSRAGTEAAGASAHE